MKRVLCFALSAVVMASITMAQGQGGVVIQGVASVSVQGPGGPPAPATLAVSLQRAYAGIKTNVTQAADQFSETDYNAFKPNPAIRTFGGQIGHIANFHYLFCAAAKGVPNPNMGKDLEMLTTKAEFVKALADSFAFCDDAFSALTDASAVEMIAQGRGQAARGGVLANLVAHDNEEYGIVTVYMRLKEMVPPSTANTPQRGRGGPGGGGRGGPGGGGQGGGQRGN